MLFTSLQTHKESLTMIFITFQQVTRQNTYQKEFKSYNRWLTNRLIQFGWPFQWLMQGLRPFKLPVPSLSSASHEQGGLNTKEVVTVAHIMDCPTFTVHSGKYYKALIDSAAAFSFIRYSTYQLIDNSFKTPIQPTDTKLNRVNGSPMTALGMRALHLRIADFKFTHNFVICDKYTEHRNNFWYWYSKEILNIICLG